MDPVQEIKQRLSISEVARDYVTLHPGSGPGNFKALCPFHDDHNPSFVISDSKGFAWCFACNTGGDIFSFVEKVENCTFREALTMLAQKAGVALDDYRPPSKKSEAETERGLEILEAATGFFEKQLYGNPKAQKILAERKLSPEIFQKFRVGFAPDADHALEKHLLELGFSRKEMLDTGLVTTDDYNAGAVRDKFRNRIMFPIKNSRGNIVGFGGRYIGSSEKAPKYLNSPETKFYKKSEILYGLAEAKEAIRQQKTVIAVEGYFDVLACHAVGIEHVIAVSGTAFTTEHAKLLKRSAKSVALALDVDEAGQTASRRTAIIALQNDLEVEVVSIPGGKDPDEAVREDKAAFVHAVAERKPAMEAFVTRALLHRDPQDIGDKKAILDELLPLLDALPRAVEREHYLSLIADRIGSRPVVLEREMLGYRKTHTAFASRKPAPAPATRKITRSEYLFGILLSFPELFEEAGKHLLLDLMTGEEKRFYKQLEQHYNESGSLSPESMWQSLPHEEVEKWRALALYAEEQLANLPESLRSKELITTITKLNQHLIPKKLTALSLQLKDGKSNSTEIIVQINELTKLMNKFHHS